MKKIIFIVIFINALFIYKYGFTQCRTFAKKVCKLELLPYVHDGIYNATVLSEGETAELYKTFYAGQEYRIVICSDENLPPVHFQILDTDRNVLYDNRQDNYSKIWDFKLQTSKQLIISVQVQTSEELTDHIASGCVAVLVGFLNVEDEFKK